MITMSGEYLAATAEAVARGAHDGQVNKHNGEPYIHHPERVVEHLRRMGADAAILAVAWLHDVIEDTKITLDDLRTYGFPQDIIDDVDAITHRPGESRTDYYQRLGRRLRALIVKVGGDLRDNNNPERRATLPEQTRRRLDAKYQQAYTELTPFIIKYMKEN